MLSIAFAIFSIFAFVGGISFNSDKNAQAAVSTQTEIEDAEDLYNRITNYGSAGAVSNFVLTADIDMKDYVLHSTIGTEENPFKGTFDGQGHTISNLTVDLSQTLQGDENNSANKYVGLFGITNGATISNLQLSGTTNLKIGNCTTAYVGALVGYAQNTTIKYIQNVSSVKLGQQTFGHGFVFGGLVGSANSCNISYVVNRQADVVPFSFSDNKDRVYTIGGVVGSLMDSSFVFGVSKSNFNIVVADTFVGKINFGGVFGSVSGFGVVKEIRVSVANMLVENNITFTNNQTNPILGKVYAGQVGGVILSPYPPALALSSIYYKKNVNTVGVFGEINSHVFDNPTTYDNILETNVHFANEDMVNAENMRWHTKIGRWDFDRVWYFNYSTIYLQSFLGGFKVEVAQDTTSLRVFKIEQPMKDKYLYGSSAEIVFSFKQSDEGASLSQYYNITGLKKGGVEKVKIENVGGVYKVVSSTENDTAIDDFAITEKNGVFTITIKNINRSTAGSYDIACESKQFNISTSSRLYDAEGNYQDSTEPPANIYFMGSDTPVKLPYVFQMSYGLSRTLEARLRNSSLPYALEGWYLEVEDGDDILLGSSNAFEIKFGFGYFTENQTIYAKYRNDACRISFDVKGDGIAEIYVREALVQGNSTTVSKTLSSLKLEIYVKEGYSFDVKRFLDMISIYRGEDSTTPFCTWMNESSGDESYYVFNLDMTILKGEFAEEFSVIIDTEKLGGSSNNMIWYIVGGVGGGVLLAVVIFLIVFFVKRKGSGGGGKLGGYNSKKSFKGGYY